MSTRSRAETTEVRKLSAHDLAALLEHVEKAEGPDREIDALICEAFQWNPKRELRSLERYRATLQSVSIEEDVYGDGSEWQHSESLYAMPVTFSIDAAVALVEKVLPGCEWFVWNEARDQNDIPRGPGATLWHNSLAGIDGFPWSSGDVHHAKTPALALIAALLRAIISNGGK